MSRPQSLFYREEYSRDLNFKKRYNQEAAFAIARMRNISIEEANILVEKALAKANTRNPKVNYLGKNEFGDRIKCTTTMEEYLQYVAKEKKILTGTLVAIDNHKENPGVIPRIITGRKKKRKKAKGEMFAYIDKGDSFRASLKNAEQNNLKRDLNALSGSESSHYNIFYIASGHPILTSTGRVATSTANSSNERFLAGNRPYYTVDHVIEDITHVCNNSDIEIVKEAIIKYNLHIPTVDEIMTMINYSTVYYWESEEYMSKIRQLVSGLTDEERVMIMYNGDFYHLTIYNKELVTMLFDRVTNIDASKCFEDQAPMQHGKDGGIELFAKSTMIDDLKNIDFTTIKTDHPEVFQKLCNSYYYIENFIKENMVLVRAFWVTKILPRDIGHFPESYRKVGLLSDTDSTVFTTQFYLEWYLGKDYNYDNRVWAIASFLTYLISSIIQHYLAQISTNFGTDEEHRYILSMKSEFLFGMLGLTGRGKHYYSNTLLQEGKLPKSGGQWEIKGSALIASKVSDKVASRAHQMLKLVVNRKMNNEPVYVQEVLDDVCSLEKEIEQSILSGNVEYLKMESIRNKSAYKSDNPPQYFNYEFWQEVYSSTYGGIEHLPYDGVRLTLSLTNKTRLNEWLSKIKDPVIKEKITECLAKRGKTSLPSIVLPLNNISSSGIPVEFHSVIDMKLTIAKLIANYYLVLDSFGLYITRNNGGKNIITTRDRIAMSVDEFSNSERSVYQTND